ncbi:MAG: hypothetical protein U0793_24685 [Gemmataceae bacterium]
MRRLTEAAEHSRADDLVAIHNELFPEEEVTEAEVGRDSARYLRKIVGHIKNGLESEEIVDLWNVAFPGHRGVWFDEEEGLIHYDETTAPVGQAE